MAELRKHFPPELGQLHVGPWIKFQDAKGPGWAQPDALVVADKTVIIVEAKLTHCLDAGYQLKFLYLPLIKAIFPQHKIGLLEVCKFPKEHAGMVWLESPWDIWQHTSHTPEHVAWHWLPTA